MWASVIEIGKFVGGSAVFIGVIAWLVRSLIGQALVRDLEKYKADLRVEALEREIRLSTLQDRLASALEATYSSLQVLCARVELHVLELSSHDTTPEQEYERVRSAFDEFRLAYRPRKILFPKTTAERLDELDKSLMKAFRRYTMSKRMETRGLFDKWEKLRAEIDQIIDNDVPELLASLEREFRKLLGAETDQQSK